MNRSSPRQQKALHAAAQQQLADGNLTGALRSYRKITGKRPRDGQAWFLQGAIEFQLGNLVQAERATRKATTIAPDVPEAWLNLGVIQQKLDQPADAVVSFQTTLKLDAGQAQALAGLGACLLALKQLEAAEPALLQALQLEPNNPAAHANLANLLELDGDYDRAEQHAERAQELDPGQTEALITCARLCADRGETAQALQHYQTVLEIDPKLEIAWHNRLLTLNYSTFHTPEEITAEHLRWGENHAQQSTVPKATTNERIRIGYVSPDFRRHSVAYFIQPLLKHHDRNRFEVFCYNASAKTDEVTTRIQNQCDQWREITHLNDQDAAKLIRADKIQILVDLAGHMAGNRLGLFALQPAPLQVSYLGYPNTTGLPQINCRIADWITDPEGSEHHYSEQLLRTNGPFLCYQPPEDTPAITPREPGPVRFGSFNNLAKITDTVIATWAALLHAVPESTLLLKSKALASQKATARVLSLFKTHNIDPNRLLLEGWQTSTQSHLERYNSIDVALDTFPYNGTTTTCEALWMGVPVVTLQGDRHAARVGASLLTAVGHPEWIATTIEEYVECAAKLSHTTAGGESLWQTFCSSPLTDGADFIKGYETLLTQSLG